MTKWFQGKRIETPPKCDNPDCPACKNQGAKDPNQLELIRNIPVEFDSNAFKEEDEENRKL